MAKKKKAKEAPKQGKKAKKKKDDFFVSIPNPGGVQVPLLEARRDILESMKLFQDLKVIRRKKTHQKALLRKQVAEITKHINAIRASIPNVAVEEDVPKMPAKPDADEGMKVERRPASDMERIEDGLRDIEAKLARLQR